MEIRDIINYYQRTAHVTLWVKSTKNYVIPIPQTPSWGCPIGGLIRILNEVIHNYNQDEYRICLSDVENCDSSHLEQFMDRESWRFGSIIVYGTLLHGIMEKHYSELYTEVSNIAEEAKRIDHKKVKQGGKLIAETLYIYRNKVFAHTSYSDPRRDSRGLQTDSLGIVCGSTANLERNELSYGAVTTSITPKSEALPVYKPSVAIRDIKRMVYYYSKKIDILMKVMSNLSEAEYIAKIVGFKKIIRYSSYLDHFLKE